MCARARKGARPEVADLVALHVQLEQRGVRGQRGRDEKRTKMQPGPLARQLQPKKLSC